MADDLEAFLRQAAQRRSQRQKPAQPKPSPPQSQPPRAPAASQPARVSPSPPVVAAVVVPENVLGGVKSRVDTSSFETRAGQLGEEVGLADEAMEAHLQGRFDHQIGTLSTAGLGSLGSPEALDAVADSQATAASDVVALLQNTNTVRQAVLLSEILTPPHHRW